MFFAAAPAALGCDYFFLHLAVLITIVKHHKVCSFAYNNNKEKGAVALLERKSLLATEKTVGFIVIISHIKQSYFFLINIH